MTNLATGNRQAGAGTAEVTSSPASAGTYSGRIHVEHGDSREVLKGLADDSVASIVTDPPYALVSIGKRFGKDGSAPAKAGVYARGAAGFMGKQWDNGDTAFDPVFWAEALRVLKPGGHIVAFGGTRTYHRLACAIEDAGFEIRDMISWLYGSGFPKSHNVSKGIDKAAGAEREVIGIDEAKASRLINQMHGGGHDGTWQAGKRDATITAPATDAARQWEGWGTALKPALEPICFARKPLAGTVAANVLAHGTGALNIDGCRVGTEDMSAQWDRAWSDNTGPMGERYAQTGREAGKAVPLGRWPANVVHDGSPEVVAAFPGESKSGGNVLSPPSPKTAGIYGNYNRDGQRFHGHADTGSAARFFYSAKADAGDRLGSKHPTVKPVDLMRWLVRLVTPQGGTCLDPFAGSGTTGMACMAEGFDCILVEREAEYVADIRRRIGHVSGQDAPLFAQVAE